jgi:hypothetical protein
VLRTFGRRQDPSACFKEIHASLNSLVVNIVYYSEIESFGSEYDEERRLRLMMSLADLRSLRKLIDDLEGEMPSEGLYQALDLMRSYAVVGEVESLDFLVGNLEPILRSARWGLALLDKDS